MDSVLEEIEKETAALGWPENFFNGLRLEKDFALPDNILAFGHFWKEEPVPHAHSRHTLVFPFVDMTYYLGAERLELSAGDVLLIPPGVRRARHPSDEPGRRLLITFDLAPGQTYLPASKVNSISREGLGLLSVFLEVYAKRDPHLCPVALFRLLLALGKEAGRDVRTPLSALVSGAIHFVERNIAKPFTVAVAAKHLNSSSSNLRLVFRREISESFGAYIRNARLERAKTLLETTSMNIAEVGAQCGFSSEFAFCRFFRTRTGRSPLRYRKFVLKRRPAANAYS